MFFYVVKGKINPLTIQKSNMMGHKYTFVGNSFEKLNILLVQYFADHIQFKRDMMNAIEQRSFRVYRMWLNILHKCNISILYCETISLMKLDNLNVCNVISDMY